MTWIDGVQKVTYPHTPGLRYTTEVRGVLWHSTEGSTFEGADSVFRRTTAAPHFTVDPWREMRVQHIETDLASYALQNLPGGVETNTAGVVQIEVVGYTDDAKAAEHGRPGFALSRLSEWQYRWLGEQVLAPILTAHPAIPHDVYHGPRMTGPQWMAWPGGICGHLHAPENCVAIETPILTTDLQWVPAGQLQRNDELIGFDEYPLPTEHSNAGRKFRPSTVEHAGAFRSPAMRVVTSLGSVVCTPDHPWLVARKSWRGWVKTKDLNPATDELYHAAEPWQKDRSHCAGWLAGLLDADGHVQTNRDAGVAVGFGQMAGRVLDDFIFEMEGRGFIVKVFERPAGRGFNGNAGFHDVRISGGLWVQARVLGTLHPRRLDLTRAWHGASVGRTTTKVAITAVEDAGEAWMASLQTSTKTYIANGFLVHNSHWDPATLDLDQVLAHARPLLTPQGDPDMALSDDDVARIASAVVAKPVETHDGFLPMANVLGRTYDELARTELLQRRLVDALVVALPVGPTGVSSEQIRTTCANAVRDVLGSLG